MSGSLEAKKSPAAKTQIALGNYLAEITSEGGNVESGFCWTVKRPGSPEILGWRRESSFDVAVENAQLCLEKLVVRDMARRDKTSDANP